MKEDKVILTARFKAKEGMEDYVKQTLGALINPTRKEKGCLFYTLHQDQKEPSVFLFYEQWEDDAAFKKHGKSDHLQEALEKLKDCLGAKTELEFFKVIEA